MINNKKYNCWKNIYFYLQIYNKYSNYYKMKKLYNKISII